MVLLGGDVLSPCRNVRREQDIMSIERIFCGLITTTCEITLYCLVGLGIGGRAEEHDEILQSIGVEALIYSALPQRPLGFALVDPQFRIPDGV